MFGWTLVILLSVLLKQLWRQVDSSEITDSGALTASTITSGTTLFDTANDPTSEHHIGKLYAHDDVDVNGTATMDGLTVSNTGVPEIIIQDLDGTLQRTWLKQSNGIAVLMSQDGSAHGTTVLQSYNGTSVINRLQANGNGDISFYDDTGSSQALYWDASAESLGIGTTSPSTTLHIDTNANGEIARFQGADAQLVINNTTSNVIDFQNAGTGDEFTFTLSGSERMRIDSSGNVGIGAAPVAGLHIQTSTRSLSLAPSGTGGGGGSYILMGNSDSGGVSGPNVIISGNRNLQFGVGDDFSSATGGTFSEYMRIDSSGRLVGGYY
jgi:hypothetical protein